jgi:hypothetical protein
VTLVDREAGYSKHRCHLNRNRSANRIGESEVGQPGPSGRLVGDDNDNDLLGTGRTHSNRSSVGDPGNFLSGVFDGYRSHHPSGRPDHVDEATLDPEPPRRVEVPNVTAAMPSGRLRTRPLRGPQLVVLVFHMGGVDADFADHIRIACQRSGRIACGVE